MRFAPNFLSVVKAEALIIIQHCEDISRFETDKVIFSGNTHKRFALDLASNCYCTFNYLAVIMLTKSDEIILGGLSIMSPNIGPTIFIKDIYLFIIGHHNYRCIYYLFDTHRRVWLQPPQSWHFPFAFDNNHWPFGVGLSNHLMIKTKDSLYIMDLTNEHIESFQIVEKDTNSSPTQFESKWKYNGGSGWHNFI